MYEPTNGFCVDRAVYSIRECQAERVSDWLFFLPHETTSERDGQKYVQKHYQPIARDIEFFYSRKDALLSLIDLIHENMNEIRTELHLMDSVADRLHAELDKEFGSAKGK